MTVGGNESYLDKNIRPDLRSRLGPNVRTNLDEDEVGYIYNLQLASKLFFVANY